MIDKDMVQKQTGESATFVVHIKSRQYSTWQGEIAWAERDRRCSFRSALELLKLIDGALDEEDVSKDLKIDRKESKS